MDYSSLAEGQQQQSDQQQAYDPAQAQAYAAYYAACDQYYSASGYYQQPYYPHDYSSSSTAASSGVYYTEAQTDSAAPHADAAQIHHSGTAYAPAAEQDGYSYETYQATAGLYPAAVAALSQLSQLTGSIDAAERMMAAGMHNRPQSSHYQQYTQHGVPSIRPGVGGVTHRGGGRRGGGPPRGRGSNRGRIGQRLSGRDGGGPPPFRGRGRGLMSRGHGRRPQQFGPDLQQRQTAIVNNLEPSGSAPKAPTKSLLPVAWCDICRVDCNSLEILEQHKNGKRHKRTVQRVQEINAQQMVVSAELQFNTAGKPDLFIQGEDGHKLINDGLDPSYATNRAVFSLAAGTEAGFVASESNQQDMGVGNQVQMPEGQSESVSDIANTGGVLTDASQDQTLPIDGLSKKRKMAGYDRWHGSKPKMMRIGRGGGGGKHFRSFDRTNNRLFERPKDRPRDRPRVCTVCNIMCDTMAVFECHLAGKKHISRIKRLEGHGSIYGPISVYIPPNQPTAYPNKGPEPLFYGLQSLEALQQEAHVANSQQVETLPAEQCYQVESFEEGEGEAAEPEVKQSLGPPEEAGAATDAVDGKQAVAMPDLDGRSSHDVPDVEETNNSAPDDDDLKDGASLEHGGSTEAEVVAPALNAASEEALAK